MLKTKTLAYSLIHSLGVLVYAIIAALLLQNGKFFFGPLRGPLAPVPILLLFTLSAAIMGMLVFARPIYWFLSGQKKEGVELALCTIAFILVITILILIGAVIL